MSVSQADIAADFLTEAGEMVTALSEQLVQLERAPADTNLINAVFRAFHTVKGGAGFLSFTGMVDLCHAAEDLFNDIRAGKAQVTAPLIDRLMQAVDSVQAMLAAIAAGKDPGGAPAALLQALRAGHASPVAAVAKPAAPAPAGGTIGDDEFEALLDQLHGKGHGPGAPVPVAAAPAETPAVMPPAPPVPPAPQAETTVRVDTRRLDKIVDLVGELVLVRNRFNTLRARGGDGELERTISGLDQITGTLQRAVMQTRMQPIGKVFARFPRLARDVARALNKEVELTLQGEDTDLDKNLVEALADPLVHLVRNAIDHGIEDPATRAALGKPRAGQVLLAAQQEGDQIVITIRDDGAGMDPTVLRNKAREKGVLSAEAAAALDDQGCFQLIFAAGFSTKAEVTEMSGRGVGMDVVKSKLTQLNGSIAIQSKRGAGSTFRIRVPLTLAILPALMVTVRGRAYAVPLATVQEILVHDPARVRKLDGRDIADVRGQTLRLIFLERWLDAGATVDAAAPRHLIVALVGDQPVGLIVDQVRGREEVVIKPLGAFLRGLAGFAGATITGDGRIALILDLPGLVSAQQQT